MSTEKIDEGTAFIAALSGKLFDAGYDTISIAHNKSGLIGITVHYDEDPWSYAVTLEPQTRQGRPTDEVIEGIVGMLAEQVEKAAEVDRTEFTAEPIEVKEKES